MPTFLAVILSALGALLGAPGDFPRLSPFTAVRVAGAEYEVELEGAWYRLVSLDGLAAADIRRHCDATYGRRSEKRFAEDLVEVLAGMGQEVGERVDLVLVALDTGERVERAGVPLTAENRRRVWEARNRHDVARAPVMRVEREHTHEVPAEYASLARALAWAGWETGPRLTREQAREDLDQLEWAVQHAYSYRDLRGVDVRAAFDALRLGLREEVALGAFITRLEHLLALFGDGHTRVRGAERSRVPGWLPFLLADARGGVVAFRPDRSGFVDPERPFVRAIDGRSIDEWLEVVAPLVAAGSPAWRRARGLRELRFLNHARLLSGTPIGSELELELTDAQGERARELRLDLADTKPLHGAWPRGASRWLDARVGYLRVAGMDGAPEALRALEQQLERFADARALVIDVRGNGGGTRDVLRLVAPRLLAPDAAPLVANVAAYRLRPGEEPGRPEGWLADRFLHPLASARWSPAERAAIERCAARFAPDWELPAGELSAWHYMVVAPAPDGVPRFHGRPVAVLQDAACFSATDVFLGALAELPNVTLVGTPSGGGSGRSQPITLAHSGLEVRLSSMASFRPEGTRYDGKGIAPDVQVEPLATDHLASGGDSVLATALELLR